MAQVADTFYHQKPNSIGVQSFQSKVLSTDIKYTVKLSLGNEPLHLYLIITERIKR